MGRQCYPSCPLPSVSQKLLALIQADRKMMPWKGISGALGPCLGSLGSHHSVNRMCGGWTLGLLFGAWTGPSDSAGKLHP